MDREEIKRQAEETQLMLANLRTIKHLSDDRAVEVAVFCINDLLSMIPDELRDRVLERVTAERSACDGHTESSEG